MEDKKITKKLRKIAIIYFIGLLLPFLSAILTDKDNARSVFIIVWPLLSFWYFIAYRDIAKRYKCQTTKFLAFTRGGGGTFHGALYSLSSFLLIFLLFGVIKLLSSV